MERNYFDPNQPHGIMSLDNMRSVFRALFQGDLSPLRPRAEMSLDDMEYGTDAAAQAEWSGTGVTVAKSTTAQEGTYSLQAAIDGTGSRTLTRTATLNLAGFTYVKVWERCDTTSSAIQFYLEDAGGNISYWDITTNGSADTWQQDTLTLASPDSNNGTDADLSDIAGFGYVGLAASITYLFDTIEASCGLVVAVAPASVGGYYEQVYVGFTRLTFSGGASPTITPPSGNPRIDLLTIDSNGALSWTTGSEAASPVAPTFPTDEVPICLVYCKTTMAKVVDYENKDANPNETYIYRDVRPLIHLATITV